MRALALQQDLNKAVNDMFFAFRYFLRSYICPKNKTKVTSPFVSRVYAQKLGQKVKKSTIYDL